MIIMPVKTVTETFHLSSYDSTNSKTVGEVFDAETGPIGTSVVGYDYGAMYNEGKYNSIFKDSIDNAQKGLQSEWNIFYNFDLSKIPEDAIIKSVSCDVLGYYNVYGEMDRQNYQKEIVSPIPRVATLQLYNGIGKPKGNIRENCYLIDIMTILHDPTAIEEKYKRIFSIDCGEWTREELKDCKLNMHVIREANQNYIIDGVDHSGWADINSCRMMAADLTVEYEIQVSVSKVVFGGNTLIDLTGDTVCPEMLAEGITAHDMAGKQITGTMAPRKKLQVSKGQYSTQIEGKNGYHDNFLPIDYWGIPTLTVEESGNYNLYFSLGTSHNYAVWVKIYNSTKGTYYKMPPFNEDYKVESNGRMYHYKKENIYADAGDKLEFHFNLDTAYSWTEVWVSYIAIEKV